METTPTPTLPLYGDVLERILSHVPTVDLVGARRVSRTWQAGVAASSRLAPRLKPWLHLRLPRASVAYDPHSRSWVPLPPPRQHQKAVLSSHPQLLYHLDLRSLSLLQPPSATWTLLPSPRAWRVDPVVALVGPTVVVAGGTWEYDDAEPSAVETLDTSSLPDPHWAPRNPIPPELGGSATWLSAAASSDRLHLLAKNTGAFSSFDPVSGAWSPPRDLRPDPEIRLSAVAFTGSRLLFAGLARSTLRLWEVDAGGSRCGEEIGRMPADMAARLVGEGLGRMTAIGFSAVGEFAYLYNPTRFREGFFYDLAERRWESIGRPKAVDDDPTARIVFGCSTVSLDQLLKLFQT